MQPPCDYGKMVASMMAAVCTQRDDTRPKLKRQRGREWLRGLASCVTMTTEPAQWYYPSGIPDVHQLPSLSSRVFHPPPPPPFIPQSQHHNSAVSHSCSRMVLHLQNYADRVNFRITVNGFRVLGAFTIPRVKLTFLFHPLGS